MDLPSGGVVIRFKNNNTYGSQSGIGIEYGPTPDLVYSKHFFGSPLGPDDATDGDGIDAIYTVGGDATGTFATIPNAFKAKVAAALP